jgi:imidazolonepropionase-like amidohydrolase
MRVAASFLLVLLLPPAPAPAQERPIAITGGVVIDGNGGPPLEGGTVLIRAGRIEAVGPAGSVTVPAGAQVIDARGKSVMPGLADMHVHLTGGWDGVAVDLLGYHRYLNSLLYAGVTTVLDVGNVQPYVLQLRQEIAAGRLTGPRIYAAGVMLDGADPRWPPAAYSIASVDQVPTIVARQKRDGVDILKAYGGLSLQMVNGLITEGAKVGLKVIMDNAAVPLDRVVQTGLHATAHLRSGQTDETIRLMKERGVFVVTTVVNGERARRNLDLSYLEEPLIKDVMPPFFLDDLRKSVAARPPANPQQVRDRVRASLAEVKRQFDAGITVVAGTDAPYPGNFQGEGVHRELELYVEAGLTPLQAITAGTRSAARLMGAEGEWGTLQAGRRADVLVIAGRPDRNIAETRKVEAVIQAGRVVNRAGLRYDPKTDPGYRVGTSAAAGS